MSTFYYFESLVSSHSFLYFFAVSFLVLILFVSAFVCSFFFHFFILNLRSRLTVENPKSLYTTGSWNFTVKSYESFGCHSDFPFIKLRSITKWLRVGTDHQAVPISPHDSWPGVRDYDVRARCVKRFLDYAVIRGLQILALYFDDSIQYSL